MLAHKGCLLSLLPHADVRPALRILNRLLEADPVDKAQYGPWRDELDEKKQQFPMQYPDRDDVIAPQHAVQVSRLLRFCCCCCVLLLALVMGVVLSHKCKVPVYERKSEDCVDMTQLCMHSKSPAAHLLQPRMPCTLPLHAMFMMLCVFPYL